MYSMSTIVRLQGRICSPKMVHIFCDVSLCEVCFVFGVVVWGVRSGCVFGCVVGSCVYRACVATLRCDVRCVCCVLGYGVVV